MFEIKVGDDEVVFLSGRFDAEQVDKAEEFFLVLTEGRVVDFSQLTYISSAGLGVLLEAQKRLHERGQGLKLIKASSHIRDIFRFTGFEKVFEIE